MKLGKQASQNYSLTIDRFERMGKALEIVYIGGL